MVRLSWTHAGQFVKAHDLKIGYFVVFKKIDTRSLKVLVFDHDYYEKVIKCKGNHAEE